MSRRNIAALLLTLVSLGLLIPGVMLPIFHFSLHGAIDARMAQVEGTIMHQTYSILGMVEELWQRDRLLVASLILAFSVLVPALKAIMFTAALLVRHPQTAHLLGRIVSGLAKWSMADVFVVAVLLVYMSTGGHQQAIQEMINIMGFQLPVKIGMTMESSLMAGFYYFTGYCLLSIVAVQCGRIQRLR